ncbi:hypothetical protein ACHAQH_006967 [Verticillium albo-atrum]
MSVTSVITTFFDHYAGYNWQTQVAFDPFFHQHLRYNRSFREPLCMIGWHSPVLNTATVATKPTVKVLAREFQRARQRLSTHGMTWAEFLGESELSKSGLSAGAGDFLGTYKSYIKMDIHYWGSSLEKGCKLVGWLESRCVGVLIDLGLQLPGLMARIWPQRFTESQTEDMSTSGHYQGVYLIGLDWDEAPLGETSGVDLKAAQVTLESVIQQFARRIQGDEGYFDPQRSWFDASLVRASELGALSLDNHDWGEYQSEDSDSDDDVHDPLDDALAQHVWPGPCSKGAATTYVEDALPAKPEGAPKLRTAADVLHRLRWDPGMRSDDFVIGYTDRHLPEPQEKAVEAWKAEQTHEEFIPQHRILYFKRRSDGELVWERRTRTDKVFGARLPSSSTS